jgi:heme O synthase-like polyprenyltransferase
MEMLEQVKTVEAHSKTFNAKDYLSLTKPRLSGLVIFTAGIGVYLAPGNLSYITAIISLVSTSLLVAGACAINCYIERDIDKLMKRTSERPIPSGRINPLSALLFGSTLVVGFSSCSTFASKHINCDSWFNCSSYLYFSLYAVEKKISNSRFCWGYSRSYPTLNGLDNCNELS